jgi:hypothetical protein
MAIGHPGFQAYRTAALAPAVVDSRLDSSSRRTSSRERRFIAIVLSKMFAANFLEYTVTATMAMTLGEQLVSRESVDRHSTHG